jgi:MFS transporter, MHS family, proline/betaine transporter
LVHRVVTSNWQALLLCGGIVIVYNHANYMLLTYMPSYLSENLDINETAGLLLLFVAIVFMLALITRVGILSDRVGRKPVLIGAVTGFVLLTYPAYWERCPPRFPTGNRPTVGSFPESRAPQRDESR